MNIVQISSYGRRELSGLGEDIEQRVDVEYGIGVGCSRVLVSGLVLRCMMYEVMTRFKMVFKMI